MTKQKSNKKQVLIFFLAMILAATKYVVIELYF